MSKRLRHTLITLALAAGALVPSAPAPVGAQTAEPYEVLVFSATYGFRHPVIPKSNLMMLQMGQESGKYNVTISENPADIRADNLANFDAVVFNSTAGKTPLMPEQRDDFIRWVACGGGFMGIAMAADSNYAWPEYTELINGNIVTHPLGENHEPVKTLVMDADHPVTKNAFSDGTRWFDNQEELYLFRKDPRRLGIHPLLALDEKTIPPEIQNSPDAYPVQPTMAWTDTFRGGGRTIYNGFGHGDLSWDEEWFQNMVHDGITWVAAKGVDLECAAGDDPLPPAPKPPAAKRSQLGKACTLPKSGPYAWRADAEGKKEYITRRLTVDGIDGETMPVGAPAYIFAPNQRFVLDLSKVPGAKSADLDITMNWTGAADFDLGITLPWGFAGSSTTPPVSGEIGVEHVVVEDAPHCTDFLIAAEHFWSAMGVITPTLTVEVTPDKGGKG
jgi:type 1 glutamine amidotransferase